MQPELFGDVCTVAASNEVAKSHMEGRVIKAVSLWEPWASAMALGLKANETRSWPAPFRGDVVICAAKRVMTELELEIYDGWIKPAAGKKYAMPYGCAVALVEVYDCVRTAQFYNGEGIAKVEWHLGNYEPGRWAWKTRNLRRLRPFPVTGRQGIFTVPEDLVMRHLEKGGSGV